MARGKVISFWSDRAGAGRRTVARELAQVLAAQNQQVLFVETGHPPFHPEPVIWVPRFKSLSPLLLRNFLTAPEDSYGRLGLEVSPQAELFKEMLELATAAFDWVFFVGPRELSPQVLPILDASDLLVWIHSQAAASGDAFQSFLDQLSRFHVPHAYVQVMTNWGLSSEGALAVIEENQDTGFRFHESLKHLAAVLQSRTELFKPSRPPGMAIDRSPENIIEQIRQQVQPELLKALEEQPQLEAARARQTVESFLAKDATLPASRQARGDILSRVLNDVMGLGPLEPLIKDPDISEIMVNGPRSVYVEKQGKLVAVPVTFTSDKQLRTVIDRIVAPLGRRVDESMPLCDARLADGSRVNIVLPPLALDGASLTIRKFSARALGFPELIEFGSVSPPMAEFLKKAVLCRRNLVVSGGTGSGKTTLLNALSSAIPEAERIVTIEDAAELRLQKPHVVRLESRPANAEGEGAIPIRRLVMNALRMRPDRIVVGECRGGEALDMLQAMNTGHDGSMTTVHANSPRDALGRMETLVLMAGIDLPVRVVREQIRSAVHFIVQQSRLPDGSRKVISITEVTGMEGDTLTTQELFHFKDDRFEATGMKSRSVT